MTPAEAPYLFLVNGQYRTAEEVNKDAARAVRDAEKAAALAEEAAREAEVRSIHWSPYDRVRVVNADP